jgi:hemerythrin-like domain-containing protein
MSTPTDTFRRQHSELFDLAKELATALGDAQRPLRAHDALVATAKLAGKLRVHAAMEDEALYPRLFGHESEEVRVTARRFSELFGGAYKAFIAFRGKWTADDVAAKPDAFIAEARALIAALGERVTHENGELYPLVDRLFAA